MTEHFYVYEHRRADTGEVFYVGKGRLARIHERIGRNLFWQRIVAKAGGFTADVVAFCRTEELAFRLERALIAMYGRRIEGGVLCNLTLGGEGSSGLTPSEEARAKLRLANGGQRHVNWGKKLSAETCRRKSESMKASPKSLRGKKLPQEWRDKIRATKYGARNPMFGKPSRQAKRVRHRPTGAEYRSITEAAGALGYSIQGIANMLTGFRPNTASVEYV